MTKQDVIFEVGCEELPSFTAATLSDALAQNVKQTLDAEKLKFDDIIAFGTPRRLAILIKGVSERQDSQHTIKLGPSKELAFDSAGKPTQALLGFCRSNDIVLADVKFQLQGKVERVIVEKHVSGELAIELLPKCFKTALAALPIAKPMYWGENIGPFVRPVHWVLSLYGSQLIPGEYFNIKADRMTKGHRYHFPERYELEHAQDYEKLLVRLKVIPSFAKRRAVILDAIKKEAEHNSANLILDENLLDEVTSIVEWPVAVTGSFSEHFLELPAEVLITSMQQHQKCFALKDKSNKLQAKFITILNIESKEVEKVIKGNEKVICARLNDADFFFKNDQKEHFISLKPKLSAITFQIKLGSVAEKVERLTKLLPIFCPMLKD